VNTKDAPRTFEDFLPPSAITSPGAFSESPSVASNGHLDSVSTSSSFSKSHSRDRSTSRFVSAVQRTAIPRMQEVVKRSLTMVRKPREIGTEPQLANRDRGALTDDVSRSNSSSSSMPLVQAQGKITRSATTASVSSRRSTETAMSTTSTLTPVSVNAEIGRSRPRASAHSRASSSTRAAIPL
jgi:hypothetical protein